MALKSITILWKRAYINKKILSSWNLEYNLAKGRVVYIWLKKSGRVLIILLCNNLGDFVHFLLQDSVFNLPIKFVSFPLLNTYLYTWRLQVQIFLKNKVIWNETLFLKQITSQNLWRKLHHLLVTGNYFNPYPEGARQCGNKPTLVT